jgi:hypothetical protein
MRSGSKTSATIVLMILAAAATAFTLMLPKIPQDPTYHHFADCRSFLGIPNTLDVLSNIPLVVLGAIGVGWCLRKQHGSLKTDFRVLKILAFSTIFLTGFGSSIYHWRPNDISIIWDRVPLSVMFMVVFLVIMADRIGPRIAGILAWPAIVAGPASVYCWRWSELQGAGDLRFYGIVQLLPMVLIPALILLQPKGAIKNSVLWQAFAWYTFAKLVEFQDELIYGWTGLFSGHTLKHICAGISVYYLLRICSMSNERKLTLEIKELEAA